MGCGEPGLRAGCRRGAEADYPSIREEKGEETMADRDRRELREIKRVVKRLGNQHARREVKRRLSEALGPDLESDEDPLTDGPDYGRFRSAPLNGMDRDATRRRRGDGRSDHPEPGSDERL
jgi:hypothetical protein